MMDSFVQILQLLPRGDASASNNYSGNATPFKVQVNFEIPIFEGQIDTDAVDKWLNMLDGYFCVHEFSSREKIVFALLKAAPHVKDWWETYYEQKDEKPSATVATTKIQKNEPEDPEEWERLFHSQMWVKGSPLQFIVDSGSQMNLVSAEVVKRLGLPTTPHPQPYSINGITKDEISKFDSSAAFPTASSPSQMRYIQEEMEFLNISSLGMAYRYAVKIEQKFKQKKRDFGSANPKPKGRSQGGVTQDNPSKLQETNNTTKLKKDTGKWCEFHKSPTHNTSECRAKQSLVAELKASESDECSDSEPEPDKGNGKGKQIIDAEPSATVATTKIQKNEPEDPEEGECLFHSQMWVKGSLLQFIVDSGNQKNLISAEVVKQLGLPTTPHPQAYSIGWLHKGRDLKVRQ
eukprot:PITA_14786